MRFDEAELRERMLAALAGDRDSYRELLARSAVKLRAYFSRRLAGRAADVDDLIQETLMSLHAKRASYLPALPFTPWLFAIARHRLIDHLRREGRRAQLAVIDILDEVARDEEEAIHARADIEALLAQLPARQARALRLTALAGHQGAEAAEIAGQTPGAIKVNVHRGMQRLKALVQNEIGRLP